MTTMEAHVAIIGAGPYGLAAAAHLTAAHVETAVFGRAMEFWKNHMPAGMLLRSPWAASHISGPGGLKLDDYYEEHGIERAEPISLERFVEYGRWFQRLAVPQLDTRQVLRVDKTHDGFCLWLDDEHAFKVKRVVIATGIALFAHRPDVFHGISPQLASHSADHRDLTRFAGKSVVVAGGGQSALESAALLSEAGAEVELIARTPFIRWLHRRELMRNSRNPFRRLLFHPTDVGPPLLTQISARPEWFKRIPAAWQPRFAHRCIRPAGAAWLRSRMGAVKITTGCSIISAQPVSDKIVITLDDASTRRVDHVLLATGYRIDISRYGFLAPELARTISCHGGYPDLAPGLESSVPGLHFLGAPAALSFGPLMRFVSGTAYAARALKRSVLGVKWPEVDSRRRRWLWPHLLAR
jgi:hypothetical protein